MFVKYRYTLSDGVASVKAIVTENVFSKMLAKPKRLDVIRVTSCKKIELKQNEAQWIININAPVELLFGDIKQVLGAPQEISTIKDEAFDFNKTVPIVAAEEDKPAQSSVNAPAD